MSGTEQTSRFFATVAERMATRFLEVLLHDDDGTRRAGVLSTPCRVPGRHGLTARFATPDDAVPTIASRLLRISDAGSDVYVGVQLLRRIPPRTVDGRQPRGGAADTAGLVAFAGDIDVAGPGHAPVTSTGLPLPPGLDDTRAILAGLPDPTFTIWTGGGLHAWWVLRRHEHLDVTEAAGLVRGWGDLLVARGRAAGWHVDQTGDLARVLRLPGTRNSKSEYPDRPAVQIVSDVSGGTRYGLDELAVLIPPPAPAAATTAAPVQRAAGDGAAPEITARWSEQTDWSSLMEPAGWRCCRDNGHGERHWTRPGKTAGTSAVSHDGEQVYLHVFTSGAPPFDEGETLSKFDVYARLHHAGDRKAAWRAIAPPLGTTAPDIGRLVAFVRDGGPQSATPGRLVWAARQIARETGRDALLRPLIRAALARGVQLDDAAAAAARGLRTPERTSVGH